jgi:MFS family permease
VLFGLASVASAYAQDPAQLIAARAAMGIGGAAVMPATLAIISNVFPARERAKAIGIWAGSVGLAIAIGPITGGVLLDHFWWGSVFLINVPIVLLGLALIGAARARVAQPEPGSPRPDRRRPADHRPDGPRLRHHPRRRHRHLRRRAGPRVDRRRSGVLAAFVRWELHTDHPALDVRLFREARFSAAVSTIGITFFALMGATFFMVFYLQIIRGWSPLRAGVMLLPLAVAQMIFAPLSVRFVRLWGIRAVTVAGLSLAGGAFLLFLALGQDSSVWILEGISSYRASAWPASCHRPRRL